ncbi:rho GTPase-activating protein 26 isoform X4 [Patella vulgata]|uniref:rho GTPase-activating protein 26 isoform X4 n=1 Tax=Patella vulgata TaxID=6465 RepID=UPI00217F6F34|nr:rho GTPase-activating protein 26 isoform X4 [Patella vulgata]
MGLQPLEFGDCLTDSPFFREKLHEHEKELERTSKAIKNLIQHGNKVLEAAKQLSVAQKQFAKDLTEFNFETINNQQTDDERIIAHSLQEFGKIITAIEEERQVMLNMASEQFVKPLETFRKENIGAAKYDSIKEEKKVFDKQTTKFCQSLERYLNMKNKVNESTLQEADASLEMERRGFYQASMKYVLKLHEVQEKKKFEFVEILLGFMYSWLTFYHQGHEASQDFKPFMIDCQQRLQKTRESFECTKEQAEQLMNKMLEVRGTKPMDQSGTIKGFTRQGYLYLMERKALGTTWTKYYCQYKKDNKEFFMILYNQLGGKMSVPEKMVLDQCIRRASESIEKRFCFDVIVKEKQNMTMTFQALSEEDRRLWLDAMDGKEPIYNPPSIAKSEDTFLDDIGFVFIKKCLAAIESRGLHEQGLYRVVGVNSKVQKLISLGLDRKKGDKLSFEDPGVWETKTITSAVKSYLRSLPEPLMGFRYHNDFMKAAKHESKRLRILDIHKLVHKLPDAQFEMLEILIGHLSRVASESDKNKMTVANLGVCFGPTLMRPEEETMAAIMDIKFCNIVVEILINNYDEIFGSQPEDVDPSSRKVLRKHYDPSQKTTAAKNSSAANNSRPVNSSTPVLSREQGAIGGHIYSNSAPVHPSAKSRSTRPVQIYNANTGGFETHSSTSGSSDSLNTSKNNHHPRQAATSPQLDSRRRGSNSSTPLYSNISAIGIPEIFEYGPRSPISPLSPSGEKPVWARVGPSPGPPLKANRYALNVAGAESPTFGSVKKRSSNDFSSSMNSSMQSSMTGSVGGLSNSSVGPKPKRLARALYRCKAENPTELSFEANQLIHNVRPSREPGWLEGTSCGKTGLLPENYVEFID